MAAAIIFAKLKISDYYSYCTSPVSLWFELIKRFINKAFYAIMNRIFMLFSGGRYSYKKSRYSGLNDIIEAEKILLKCTDINFDELEY